MDRDIIKIIYYIIKHTVALQIEIMTVELFFLISEHNLKIHERVGPNIIFAISLNIAYLNVGRRSSSIVGILCQGVIIFIDIPRLYNVYCTVKSQTL